jgi:hypothetical protein
MLNKNLQHDQLVLEIDVPSALGVLPVDRKDLALTQGLTRAYMNQDDEHFQELVCHSVVLSDRLELPGLCFIDSRIKAGILQRFRLLDGCLQRLRKGL